MSASLDCLSRRLCCFFSVVIPELKLRDVQMQIFFCRPYERFPSRRASKATRSPQSYEYGLRRRHTDQDGGTVLREYSLAACIARPTIGAEQTDRVETASLTNFVSVALWTFSMTRATTFPLRRTAPTTVVSPPLRLTPIYVLIPMPFSAFPPTKVSSISTLPPSLHDILNKGGPDLVAHEPSGLVRAEAHVTIDLKGATSLFADQHQVGPEPIFQRFIVFSKIVRVKCENR